MIRGLIGPGVVISALALVACGGGASRATPTTASLPHTPVSPPAFATAFDPFPPTPTLATVIAKRTEAAAAIPPEPQISGFSFVSAREGWVLRAQPYLGGMQVLHTGDAGATWRVQYDGLDPIPAAIQFVDAQHGWVVGESGGPYCHNIDDPLAVASCAGAVLATADGGATWHLTTPAALPITGISFTDAHDGYALAARSCEKCTPEPVTVLRTTDGGASWTTIPLGPADPFASGHIAAVDATHVVVLSGDSTYVTDDGGTTWARSPSPCVQPATWGGAPTPARVVMLDARTGWAICADGAAAGRRGSNLLQTTDGGSHWTMIAQFDAPKALLAYGIGNFPGGSGELQFSDALHGWYASANVGGYVWRTDDGGHIWREVLDGPLGGGQPQFIHFADDADGWIATSNQIARTTEGGALWTELELPK